MTFECPNCNNSGQIDDEIVPDGGVHSTCPKCNTIFIVKRDNSKKFLIQQSASEVDHGLNASQAPDAKRFDILQINTIPILNTVNVQLNNQAPLHTNRIGNPWRRFWARLLDNWLLSLPIGFMFGVLAPDFAANTISKSGGVMVLGIFVLPFVMFAEACIMSIFGTTLGKWLLNISIVRRADGDKLTFGEALTRCVIIWVKGFGFGLPLVSLFTMLFAAIRIRKYVTASWDDSVSAKVICDQLVVWKVCLTVITIIVLLIIQGALSQMK